MQVDGSRGRVFVVRHKNPICCLLVQAFHVSLVRVPFVTELLGAVAVTFGVSVVRLIEAFGHKIALRAGLVAHVHVVGIVLVNLVVLREFVMRTLGGSTVLRFEARCNDLAVVDDPILLLRLPLLHSRRYRHQSLRQSHPAADETLVDRHMRQPGRRIRHLVVHLRLDSSCTK